MSFFKNKPIFTLAIIIISIIVENSNANGKYELYIYYKLEYVKFYMINIILYFL